MPEADTEPAIVIERTIAAPIDLVWRMWTDPTEFAAWYGPVGATIPVAEIDATVGGRRRVCMEMATPDGPMRMWLAGVHREVQPPSLLVYSEQHVDESGTPPTGSIPTEVRVQLTSTEHGTHMVMTHIGVPPDSPGAVGWNMAFDKLGVHVTQPAR